MKKLHTFLTFLTVLTVLTVLSNNITLATSFPDIKPNSLLETYIDYLTDKNIINGYPDGTFKPDQTINRAEALKLIFSTLDSEAGKVIARKLPARRRREPVEGDRGNLLKEAEEQAPFPDVPNNQWFTEYIRTAKTSGIISGYPDGSFKPHQEVNRAEFVKMAMAALPFYSKINASPEEAMSQYNDLDPQQWYIPYVASGVKLKFLPKSTHLNPTEFMSRGDATEIIYNIAKYIEKHPYSIDPEYSMNFIPPESVITIDQIKANSARYPYNERESYEIYRWNGEEFDYSTHITNNEHGYIIGYGDPSPIVDASFQHDTLSIELESGCFIDIRETREYSSPEAFFEAKLNNKNDYFPPAESSKLEVILKENSIKTQYKVTTVWADPEQEPTYDHFLWFHADGMPNFSNIAFQFHGHGPQKSETDCDADELYTMNHFTKPLH